MAAVRAEVVVTSVDFCEEQLVLANRSQMARALVKHFIKGMTAGDALAVPDSAERPKRAALSSDLSAAMRYASSVEAERCL